MANLYRLNVSLTKHGAHKIASLLKLYPADEILQHLEGSIPGINIEKAQAQNNLSVGANNLVPAEWGAAKSIGEPAIDALVLIAIIFSHYKLISAMSTSTTGPFAGRIIRGSHLTGKAYTNFSHTIDKLGYSKKIGHDYFEYNLEKIFKINGLAALAKNIIEKKLKTANWDRKKSIIDESIALGFHKALSISEDQFRNWLTHGSLTPKEKYALPVKDQDFFTSAPDIERKPFNFTPGHTPKSEDTLTISPPNEEATARQLHNLIQNKLYAYLLTQHHKSDIGTEINTGDGTAIDLVLKINNEYWFYEIKTAHSVKASIRQAIPQLLEYAYWPNVEKAKKLIIVSHLPPTESSEQYLMLLRKKFGMPIHYQQFCLKTETLQLNIT